MAQDTYINPNITANEHFDPAQSKPVGPEGDSRQSTDADAADVGTEIGEDEESGLDLDDDNIDLQAGDEFKLSGSSYLDGDAGIGHTGLDYTGLGDSGLSDGVGREVDDSGLEDSDLAGVGIGTDSALANDRGPDDIQGSNDLTELQQSSMDEVRKNTDSESKDER